MNLFGLGEGQKLIHRLRMGSIIDIKILNGINDDIKILQGITSVQ